MSRLVVAAMPGNQAQAAALAEALGAPFAPVSVRVFPDGESLVRVPDAADTVVVHCTLDRPDEKLVRLMLAAGAFRDAGAGRLVLVAPYLCYMRQDIAFNPGEAVSQRVVGHFLAERFDRIVTVDPHLHRTATLDCVLPGVHATVLSAAPVLADLIRGDGPGHATTNVLVGPDAESARWVAGVAEDLGWPAVTASKVRSGDRDVRVVFEDMGQLAGRTAWLIDDVASTGGTLAACARELARAGATRIEAVVVHALCRPEDLAAMRAAGISRLRSTDSVPHPTNAGRLAPLVARALQEEIAA